MTIGGTVLDRRCWKTRVELANVIFEYLEIFHNRERRHSALGMHSRSSTRRSTRTQLLWHEVQRVDSAEPGEHQTWPRNRGKLRSWGTGSLQRLGQNERKARARCPSLSASVDLRRRRRGNAP